MENYFFNRHITRNLQCSANVCSYLNVSFSAIFHSFLLLCQRKSAKTFQKTFPYFFIYSGCTHKNPPSSHWWGRQNVAQNNNNKYQIIPLLDIIWWIRISSHHLMCVNEMSRFVLLLLDASLSLVKTLYWLSLSSRLRLRILYVFVSDCHLRRNIKFDKRAKWRCVFSEVFDIITRVLM